MVRISSRLKAFAKQNTRQFKCQCTSHLQIKFQVFASTLSAYVNGK
ncbi:hypothetical protein thalar_00298 [Litoreibacter arenae DSM 19593]|uniref:Uncharacterized protein n=1 Tax=Litoreibacter arenae DSM 19593 TaxID=1123360 RepID=S9QJW1_9RHOB|nr:hypothetical protein thalar_00298 [Litoreibacter arenae DSM 19593]